MTIIVYSTPDCVQCKYTKKWMDGLGLSYEDIDVTQDRDAAKDVRTMSDSDTGVTFTSLPVVVVSRNGKETQRWSGFKIDKIRGLGHAKDALP